MTRFTLLFFVYFLIGCQATPTGRKQLILRSEGEMANLGAQSFAAMKKKGNVSAEPKANKAVTCITHRLLVAMDEKPSDWEVRVFEDKSPNAFALPGRKIGVHTGMLDLVENQDQLAAVIGHEIGHVLAHHGNERISQQLAVTGGLAITSLVLSNQKKNRQTNQLIVAGLGIGAQFGVLLPFSRTHETEADELGVRYMAKAGFDPRQAAALWRVMQKASGGGAPPELRSTHPSNSTRIRRLSRLAPKFMGDFGAVKDRPSCF